MRGLLIAAPCSGSGKTVITQALVRLWARKKYPIIAAKMGPDYIDTQFLALAARREEGEGIAYNLDPWAMQKTSLYALLQQAEQKIASQQNNMSQESLLLIEGAMGLFDGAADGSGSSADLAALLNVSVLLVLNARGQSHSVAALVQGIQHFREDIRLCGVILNAVGSDRHAEILKQALKFHCPDVPVLGCILRNQIFDLPSRYLGLVQAQELPAHQAKQNAMANQLSAVIDEDALLHACMPVHLPQKPVSSALLPLKVQRLAIAQDAAFSFLYAGQLEAWRQRGHEISVFSPLQDEAPHPDSEAVFLPGGYPELYAGQLATSQHFRQAMHHAAESGVLIYGECGGYMVLGEGISTTDGSVFPMLGMLPVRFSMHKQKRTLGYRVMTAQSNQLFADKGARLRGHEFHYARADFSGADLPSLFTCSDALGEECPEGGIRHANVMGSFLHAIDVMDS